MGMNTKTHILLRVLIVSVAIGTLFIIFRSNNKISISPTPTLTLHPTITATASQTNTPTLTSTPTNTPSATPTPEPSSTIEWACGVDNFNCSDFEGKCEQLEHYWNICSNDPSRLDRDNDGIPCEVQCWE
jgi:hypothetical protein